MHSNNALLMLYEGLNKDIISTCLWFLGAFSSLLWEFCSDFLRVSLNLFIFSSGFENMINMNLKGVHSFNKKEYTTLIKGYTALIKGVHSFYKKGANSFGK